MIAPMDMNHNAIEEQAREEAFAATGMEKVETGFGPGVDVYVPKGTTIPPEIKAVIGSIVGDRSPVVDVTKGGKLVPLVRLGEPEDIGHGLQRSRRIGDRQVLKMADELGLNTGILMTREAHELAVKMNPAAEGMGCDFAGRVWDLLFMMVMEARRDLDRVVFEFKRMCAVTPDHDEEKDGPGRDITLKAVARMADAGPYVTIMLPDQDD